jgi:hypothetical protein
MRSCFAAGAVVVLAGCGSVDGQPVGAAASGAVAAHGVHPSGGFPNPPVSESQLEVTATGAFTLLEESNCDLGCDLDFSSESVRSDATSTAPVYVQVQEVNDGPSFQIAAKNTAGIASITVTAGAEAICFGGAAGSGLNYQSFNTDVFEQTFELEGAPSVTIPNTTMSLPQFNPFDWTGGCGTIDNVDDWLLTFTVSMLDRLGRTTQVPQLYIDFGASYTVATTSQAPTPRIESSTGSIGGTYQFEIINNGANDRLSEFNKVTYFCHYETILCSELPAADAHTEFYEIEPQLAIGGTAGDTRTLTVTCPELTNTLDSLGPGAATDGASIGTPLFNTQALITLPNGLAVREFMPSLDIPECP